MLTSIARYIIIHVSCKVSQTFGGVVINTVWLTTLKALRHCIFFELWSPLWSMSNSNSQIGITSTDFKRSMLIPQFKQLINVDQRAMPGPTLDERCWWCSQIITAFSGFFRNDYHICEKMCLLPERVNDDVISASRCRQDNKPLMYSAGGDGGVLCGQVLCLAFY